MAQLPVFYRHPETGEDCLVVVFADSREERDLMVRSIAMSWEVLALRYDNEQLFTYWHDGVLRCGTVEAESAAEAEAHLTAFAFQAMI